VIKGLLAGIFQKFKKHYLKLESEHIANITQYFVSATGKPSCWQYNIYFCDVQ
jgi:hypothetical protein